MLIAAARSAVADLQAVLSPVTKGDDQEDLTEGN
jgi:hypothetical protein